MLTLRQKRIIKLLTESRKSLKVVEISKALDVSSRTIRYDLDEIDYFLKNLGECLDRKPRVGISIKNPDRLMNEIIRWESQDRPIPYLNREERLLHLGLCLATAETPLASELLADKLCISRSAILTDLKELKHLLKETYKVDLVARKRYGYQLECDEARLRHLLGDYICQVLELNRDGRRLYEINEGMEALIKALDVQKIRRTMKIAKSKQPFWIPYQSYLMAVAIIFVLSWRIQNGYMLKPRDIDHKSIRNMAAYKVAIEISDALEEDWPEYERVNLAYALAACNIKLNQESDRPTDPKLIDTVYAMIRTLQSHMNLSMESIQSLQKDLVSHLDLSLGKLQLNIPNENLLLREIKTTYPQEFELAKNMIQIFDQAYDVQAGEDEAGFITMYIVKNREGNLTRDQRKVLIVCGSGQGASKLLTTRIRNNITNIQVVDIVSAFEIEENDYDTEGVDLIISTIPIRNAGKPVVCVSPLITDAELGNISRMLFDYNPDKKLYNPDLNLSMETENSGKAVDIESALAYLTGMVMIEIGTLLQGLYRDGLVEERSLNQWGLTLHIIMAIPRWKVGKFNTEPDLIAAKAENSEIYKRILSTIESINTKYELRIPEMETVAIMRYLI